WNSACSASSSTVEMWRISALLLWALYFEICISQPLTHTTASLSQPRGYLAAAATDDIIAFGGGFVDTAEVASDVVDLYNVTSNTWNVTRLSQPRYQLAAAAIPPFIFFAGGSSYSSVVDILDTRDMQW